MKLELAHESRMNLHYMTIVYKNYLDLENLIKILHIK